MAADFFSSWTSVTAPVSGALKAGRAARLLKRTLAIFALLGVLGIAGLAYFNSLDHGFRLNFTTIKQEGNLPPVMVKPRFQGVDTDGHPFTVTADYATQKDKQLVDLQNLQADTTLHDGSWVTIMAKKGTLNMDSKTLLLTEQVELYHDSGYSFTSPAAVVDLKKGMAGGTQRIEGQGPIGTLEAAEYVIADQGRRIHFSGGVTLVIYPKAR